MRFDVVNDTTDPCIFFFYEAYKDKTAVDFHKSCEHYKAWDAFKQRTGTEVLSKNICNGFDFKQVVLQD